MKKMEISIHKWDENEVLERKVKKKDKNYVLKRKVKKTGQVKAVKCEA